MSGSGAGGGGGGEAGGFGGGEAFESLDVESVEDSSDSYSEVDSESSDTGQASGSGDSGGIEYQSGDQGTSVEQFTEIVDEGDQEVGWKEPTETIDEGGQEASWQEPSEIVDEGGKVVGWEQPTEIVDVGSQLDGPAEPTEIIDEGGQVANSEGPIDIVESPPAEVPVEPTPAEALTEQVVTQEGARTEQIKIGEASSTGQQLAEQTIERASNIDTQTQDILAQAGVAGAEGAQATRDGLVQTFSPESVLAPVRTDSTETMQADMATNQRNVDAAEAVAARNTASAVAANEARVASDEAANQMRLSEKEALEESTKETQFAAAHWTKHSDEFPEHRNEQEYAKAASQFIETPPEGTLSKVRADGDLVCYDPNSNNFAIKSQEGAIRTFFRPDPGKHGLANNTEYFYDQ